MERDYDSRKELVEGLKKAAQGNSRNKTARLREIFDEVEAAKESGLSLKAIVAVLAERGLIFDLATFVNVRHRIKKERVKDALTIKANAALIKTELKDVPIENSLAQITTYSNSPRKEQHKKTLKDLVRPNGITDAAWMEMKVQHLSNINRTTF